MRPGLKLLCEASLLAQAQAGSRTSSQVVSAPTLAQAQVPHHHQLLHPDQLSRFQISPREVPQRCSSDDRRCLVSALLSPRVPEVTTCGAAEELQTA